MATIQLAPPYPVFTDKNGDPLDNGYLYFGVVNLNPETNPIQVYYDSAFTQPVAQPIRTSNGYVMRNGAPALIYAGSQFSVTVRDKNSDLVIYSPVGYGVDPGSIAGVVVVQDQTGDGVTTAFGMGASPSSENATNVFIDGVYQSKTGYSISGSTLTFSEAPPLYSAIEIVSNQTAIIGGTDAGLVTYNEGDTGAVTRTVKAKLQETVSVKDFGAVGDGVTDDTAAIQAAVNAANAIYFPPGEYITSLIELSSRTDISLFGGGIGVTTLKMKANIEETIIKLGAGSKRISIKNMTLDGNRTNQTPTGDGINYGILLGGEQIILENLYIKDCATDGIILNSALINGNYSISNVNVTNSRRNGFSIVQGVNCTVVSSSFNNTTGTAPQAGLDIEPSTVQTVRNIKFIACDFDGNAGDGVTAGLLVSLSSTMEDIQFISCKSRNNSGRGFRVLKYDISNIIFSGCNTTTNGKAGYLTDAESVSFNSCNSFDNDSSAADNAGFVLGANNGMIIGCISQNKNTTNQSYGISITGLATNCNVIGNDLNANNVGAIIGSGSGGITRLFNQGDGASLRRNLYGSKTWDPVSISDGAATSVDVTVTGAVIGNFCVAQLTTLTADDVTISAHVTATNTVRVVIVNHTGGALDVSSGTVSVSVFIF
jgi:hypothetical protein